MTAYPRTWPIPLALWVVGAAAALGIDDPRLRFVPHLGASLAMTAGWLWLVVAAPRLHRRAFFWCVVAGLTVRGLALLSAPAFSDDVFRYVFEGRVFWHMGPGFPFAHPPADAPALGVPAHLVDEAWLRINHPHISTIYPPFAQLVFALAGGIGELAGGTLLWLKLLLVLSDLGVWLLLARAAGPRSLVWGLCPLVVLEVAREGHADSLSALGLTIGVVASLGHRPRVGYAGFALAGLAKLNGLVALVAAARSTRRGLSIGIGLSLLLVVPFLLAGSQAGFGLTQYATRWRAGDGAFSLVLAAAGGILGGDWVDLGGWVLTKHQLARGITALIGGVYAIFVLRRPVSVDRIPDRAGLLLLGLLLLSPTLHPWYVIWLLPFCILDRFAGGPAVLALAAMAPLLHHPGWIELRTGVWTDLWWVRAMVHLPVWTLFLIVLARQGGLGYAAPPCRSKRDS